MLGVLALRRWSLCATAAAVVAVAGSVALATGAAAQEFYKGRTLSIVVGFSAGGGFDINARMLARHWGRHIPGQPDVIVVNMPGAGSLTAVRYLEQVAPRDGTQVATFNFGLIGDSRINPDKTAIDFRRLAWIGSISQDLSVCYVWAKLGLKSLTDLKGRRGLHFGLGTVGTNEDINQRILKHILGVALTQVAGYPGSAEQRVAVQRGELDGGCGSWNSLPADWVRDKLIDPVYRTGRVPAADMPAGLPFVLDLAPSDADRDVISLLTASNELGRPFVASALVPADRLAILRTAFDAVVADPAFMAEAEKGRQPVSPRSAVQASKIVESIYATPEHVVAAARKVMSQ